MGKTLLLADDSVTIQKVVGISFASEDIAIVTVNNGDDAIAKALELRPDVILADVVMPGKSGYEVCQTVKAHPSTSHIPVLLLTGTFEAFDEEHAAAVGAAGHVSKPFEAQTLVDQVRELLANPPAAPAAVAPAASAPVASLDAPTSPGGSPSFDFFDDAGEDFPVTPANAGSSADFTDPLDPAGGHLDIGESNDAFAFGDDDLSDPMGDLTADIGPGPDATVAIMPDTMPDPAATVGDASFLNTTAPEPSSDPVGFAFGHDEMAPPHSVNEPTFDPGLSDSLSISSSDLLEPQAPNAVAVSATPPVMEAIPASPEPIPEAAPAPTAETEMANGVGIGHDTLDAGPPLPDFSSDAFADDLDFASPIDDPMDVTAGAATLDILPEMPAPEIPAQSMPAAPIPEPFAAAPYSGQPFAVALDEPPTVNPVIRNTAFPDQDFAMPEPLAVEPLPVEPMAAETVATPDAAAFLPTEAEAVPFEEPPAASAPMPELIDAPPEALSPMLAEPLMAEAEPLMAPEMPISGAPDFPSISEEAVNRLVEDVTPVLRQELHQTLERVAWESFGSVTEQLVAQAVERIETIAWEVVPKLAETLIQEEIRKLKERS